MAYAARAVAYTTRIVASVSNKLSIAAVLGLAVVPATPQGAVSGIDTAATKLAAAPIEIVRAKPVPMPEEAVAPEEFQLAARRSRTRRETEPESRRDSTRKTSSISPAEPPPEPKPPESTQADPPKPDVWTDSQVIAALRECVRLLAPIAADVDVSEPMKHDQCGAPAPVSLRRIGSGAGKVELNPPAIVNCAMVASLHAWVEKTLQPAAQEVLGSPITRLRNASGYSSRSRIGSHTNSDRLSEHALANAIDIAGFVTADGRTIEVANFWGPTARDQREAERLAAARAKEDNSSRTPSAASQPAQKDRKISRIALAAVGPSPSGGRSRLKTAKLDKPGRQTSDISADPKAIPATPLAGRPDAVTHSAEAQFLRRLHKGACTQFGTVLGPEANEAHRDHFHFDLAQRRRSAFCQ